MKQDEIDPWLAEISGDKPAVLNVEGNWHDPESEGAFGWGQGDILQNGNKIKGTIGSYSVSGVVSGQTVYVVFYTKGKVYYTAILEMPERGVLSGQYFEAKDKEQKNGFPTKFIID
jgi:hypothetical protein